MLLSGNQYFLENAYFPQSEGKVISNDWQNNAKKDRCRALALPNQSLASLASDKYRFKDS